MTTITIFFLLIPILGIILLLMYLIFAPHNSYQEKDKAQGTGTEKLTAGKANGSILKKIPYRELLTIFLIYVVKFFFSDEVYLCESDSDSDEEASLGTGGENDEEKLERLKDECDREKFLYDNAKERVKSAFEKWDPKSAYKASNEGKKDSFFSKGDANYGSQASVQAGQYKNSYFSKLAELNELETTLGYPITKSEITEQTGNTYIDERGISNESSHDDSSNNGESDVSLPDKSNKGFVQSKKK